MTEMADQGELYEKSWILHHILERFIGSREMVAVRRRLTVLREHIEYDQTMTHVHFNTGSLSEGIEMQGFDMDKMFIDTGVLVVCPDQYTSIPPGNTGKTVLMMRDTDSRPGYVTLELVRLGQRYSMPLKQSIVPVGDVYFISSEMFRRFKTDAGRNLFQFNMEIHGPATTIKSGQSNCYNWPRAASEWVSRSRLHEWPDKALRDQIVQGGCHLVPVGDKTSADTFLQWRISFTTAERKLIHSLTHIQFLVYGLFKYFLKQISGTLQQILGDADILSLYIIKTVILYAVERTPALLWQEKNTFLCFMLCFKTLITWVNSGHCPNYFISSNNMFLGKVHGENQQKLLRFLIDLHDMKWECLSVGTCIQPSIGERIKSVQNGTWKYVLPPPTETEKELDIKIFSETFSYTCSPYVLPVSLALLYKSKSDFDTFIGYVTTVRALANTGINTFGEYNAARGNKEKYTTIRKCKNLLTPHAVECTSPGLLTLATYYYQTGNYMKTLEFCGHMISAFKVYIGDGAGFKLKDKDRYEHLYCGRAYSLLHKCRAACTSEIRFTPNAPQFCPPQLHQEINKFTAIGFLIVPPLPYAVFLSFLCYHELGDTRRRDSALLHLRAVKYDVEQGCGEHWIVHNFLGICYEVVGEKQRALREYRDSLRVRRYDQYCNPAMERIERLQHST